MANIGDLYVSGLKPVVSAALEVSHQLSAVGPGVLYDLTVHNYNGTARMVLLLDQTANPTNYSSTAVKPIYAWPLPASTAAGPGTFSMAYQIPPIQFINGLWVLLSTVLTTPFTATAAGASDGYFAALLQTS